MGSLEELEGTLPIIFLEGRPKCVVNCLCIWLEEMEIQVKDKDACWRTEEENMDTDAF